jgi:anthranilate synthase component 2
MKILVLDNYDSFTYNLVHIIKELGYEVDVFRNDKISLEAVGEYDKILLSPGPGIPSEAGILQELIHEYAPTKSILGVCLGHQAIAECFGAELFNLGDVLHGIPKQIKVTKVDELLFQQIPKEFLGGRYHSWAVKKDSLTDVLELTATDEEGEVMGIAHKTFDVRGVQFHPESVLTEFGKEMIENWLTDTSS